MTNKNVRISITGKNPKIFLKMYIFNKIDYVKFKEISYNRIELNISYEDYLKLREIKSTNEIKIVKLYKLDKLIYLIKNNYTALIAFIISMLFLLLISNTIFEIDVIHNDSSIRKLVKECLKEEKIDTLRLVPSFNKRKRIINRIIKENKDRIEWLEIERKGSRLIVKVTERRINKKEESKTPRHVVAKKSGIITKIEASNGVILKKKNDYVSKGEIIISGDIIKDETVKGRVRAKGVVYAETWYKVNVIYPLNYNETIYLDDVKENIIIHFINKDISIRKNYAKNYLENKHVLIKSKILPFSIRLEKQRKTKIITKKYSKDKALEKAIKLAAEKIKKKLDTDEYIIDKKTLNLSTFNSRIEVDVFFKVNENITDYEKIDESIIEENLNNTE